MDARPRASCSSCWTASRLRSHPPAKARGALLSRTGTSSFTQRTPPWACCSSLTYRAKQDSPVKYKRATVQMTAPNIALYYVPAYVWSREPVDVMPAAGRVQTRMTTLGVKGATLCLVPGTDRGTLGIHGGAARSDLLLGPAPTPVLLTGVAGDWWKTYQFATTEIYDFQEQRQTVPVSEIQYGISRYLLSDEVWEPTLGTVRSWPDRDPHYLLYGKGFECFQFYGSTYSIPAYWQRYVMNGDKLALDRCRSIARWLCRSGIRVKDGPARGAFFNLQRFTKGEPRTMDKVGATQANQTILTCQSTGSALWTLLFYRKMTGDHDPEINLAIDEAAKWLVDKQSADGGWPYAFNTSGKELAGASSGGSIWNIWALWRLGRETGDAKYLQAAEHGIEWYDQTFIREHHYHGYWEDVGPGSREGYEAAVAALAFNDMGRKDLVVQTARDAVQWVFTRQIESREPNNSAGLVAEQTGWPPASYCNPMMGLAAYSAWKITGDDYWRPFAKIPKAIGWWYQPETGAMVWIVDATIPAPMVGPAFESWWADWCIGQVGTLSLRWLVREVCDRSAGALALDEETLRGKAFGAEVQAWAPPGGLKPILPQHGQVNWLGLRSSDCLLIAFLNDGPAGEVTCPLDSRDVKGATLSPKAIHRIEDGQIRSRKWNGGFPIKMESGSMVVLEWGLVK